MAFVPSDNAKQLAKQSVKELNLIVEIEGIPFIFGSQDISRLWKFDDGFEFDTTGLRFDTAFPDPNARDYISLKKTSKTISQQVLPDKKGTSSTLKMDIELVDIDGFVTDLFKANNYVTDIIGQKAEIWIGFKQGSHPEDSIKVISGYLTAIKPTQGAYIITVSHSENKKRQQLFNVYTSQLVSGIDDISTTIDVGNTSKFIEASDSIESYVQIDDEIMQVTSITDSTMTVIRSRLNTIASSHDIDADVSSIYGLSGNAIDTSLKLYLSGGDEYYTSITATSFNDVNGITVLNSIFFLDTDVISDLGVTEGDSMTITGASNTSNNGTFTVDNIFSVSNGTYIISDNSGFTVETGSSATVQFKSKYNVLNEGLGLTPFEIDIATHEQELSQNFASLPSFQFYLKEEINAKDFIDGELYFPSALYSINRNAKISCKYLKPPLANEITPQITSDNIIEPSKIQVIRDVNKFNYNAIVYRYEKSVLNDKFLAGNINTNPTAKATTDNTNHTYQINSDGLRRTSDTNSLIDRQNTRIYQRYQYGATLYKGVQISFGESWNLETGDVVEFGDTGLMIPDTNAGTRYTDRRLVEIINKSMDFTSGKIMLDLLETGFNLDLKYGVFSPASLLTANSTTTQLELKLSFYTGDVSTEREKWQNYLGKRIRVRSDDYSFDETVTIDSFDNINNELINITPALSLAPSEDYIVEIPLYDESDAESDSEYKERYTYQSHQAIITSVTDDKTFDVATPERFIEGGRLYVHSPDYTNTSFDNLSTIDTIVGNTITLTSDLPFTPLINDEVENLTFKDGLDGFRLI